MKKKKSALIFFFFISSLVVAAYVIFRPTPAKDMQTFCEMAKLSHLPPEVMNRTMDKVKTDEFFDFISGLSRLDSSLKYQATVLKAEDFGLKNWECPALQKLWK